MGYKARDTRLERLVALKLLLPDKPAIRTGGGSRVSVWFSLRSALEC